jgi:SAM-dependent methyltransferase
VRHAIGTDRLRTSCCSAVFVSIATAQSGKPPRQPDVSYVATTKEAVQMMLKLADVKKSDVVYDLGCGDGRIVIAAAKIYGARGVGINIDPRRILESKNNAKKAGVESLIRFEENDLFKADIHEATVVTLFLLSSLNFPASSEAAPGFGARHPNCIEHVQHGRLAAGQRSDCGD